MHWQLSKVSLVHIIEHFMLIIKDMQKSDLLREKYFSHCVEFFQGLSVVR